MRLLWTFVLIAALLLTGCAGRTADPESESSYINPSAASSPSGSTSSTNVVSKKGSAKSSVTSAPQKTAKVGQDNWFMDEFISPLELVLGIRNYDSKRSTLEDELFLFAYLKLESRGEVDKYFVKEKDAFFFSQKLVDDIIFEYFGKVNISRCRYFDRATRHYTIGIQSFGSVTRPEIVKKTTVFSGKVEILVDNINPDLPKGKRVVLRRKYVFTRFRSGYILESARVESYNPPK